MASIVTMKDNVRLFIWDEGQNVTAADKVGNITQIGDFGGETEDIDVTTIESSAREYANGFDDNGTVDVTQNVTTNEYSTMNARKNSGIEFNFGVSVFDKEDNQVIGIQGKAIIKSVKLTGISVGGLLQVVSSLRINGEPTEDFVDPIGYSGKTPVTGITVGGVGGASTIDEKSGTLQMIATITPANATKKAVNWSVDEQTKATISSTGLLTAKANGTVQVTATATDGSGVTGSTSVVITGQDGE